jgi:transmembrane sensor
MKNGTEGPATREPEEWEALARYLAGESPPAEAEAVRAWLAADPARAGMVSELDAVLDRAAAAAPADVDVEAALARVHARMGEPKVIPISTRRPAAAPARTSGWRSPALRIAAAAVLMIGGALLVWRLIGGGGGRVERIFATGVGERDSIRLADGTRVILGPDSRLAVVDGYGGRTREVELAGEALFDAVHDDARPFTVLAGGARVRDIGTTFSVSTGGEQAVRVVVTSGAVVLRAEGAAADSVVLREGDRGEMEAEGRVTAERGAATEDDLAWTRGRLVFTDAPLARVADDLRRWYGVELRAGDPALAGRRLTASFDGEPRESVLQVIALALGAEVEMRGDTAVLRPGTAP